MATRWDGALELGVNYMGKPTTVPFTVTRTPEAEPDCAIDLYSEVTKS